MIACYNYNNKLFQKMTVKRKDLNYNSDFVISHLESRETVWLTETDDIDKQAMAVFLQG
jgi:hypothetical protein